MKNNLIYIILGSFKLGGTERTASRVGKELLNRGYNVKFLLINGIFDYSDPTLINNSIILSKSKNRLLKIISTYLKLLSLTWSNKPKRLISFSLGLNYLSFFTFYPKLIFRIEANIFIYKKKLYRRYLQKFISVFPHVYKVVVPSKGLANSCKNYFFNPSKIIHIDNPLNIEEIELLKNEEIREKHIINSEFIVSAARLHENKGFKQLIEIYAKSALVGQNIKLIILGNGPQYEILTKTIEKLNLQEHVFLLGYVHNPYKYFNKAKYFILNSSHESFGNVIIEAFACNIPVISNDCDFGPRHIIQNGYNGLLYNREDENSFKKAMELMFSDEKLFHTIKENATHSKHKYAVEKITDVWVNEIIG